MSVTICLVFELTQPSWFEIKIFCCKDCVHFGPGPSCDFWCACSGNCITLQYCNADKFLPNLKSQNSAFEAKFKYFLVARDQMQTLYSTGKVFPRLRYTAICRCLWHRARILRVPTAHAHPKTHTIFPLAGKRCKGATPICKLNAANSSDKCFWERTLGARLKTNSVHFLG